MSWSDVSGQWVQNTAVDAAVILIQLQSPADLSNLTADPPEDLIIDRVVGDFRVALNLDGNWTLGLLVQDVTWTIGATFSVDADKRVLWHQTFDSAGVAMIQGYGLVVWDTGGTPQVFSDSPGKTHLDISPRVKIQPGQALYLAAWENTGAATLTSSSTDMRVLYHRARRS